MSIHKLTAGSGYDYLTRQVAALDATEKGHLGLASYYTERGESPGVWVGSGMAGIDELNPGDVVTTDQMRALFGAGLHPLAEQRQRQLHGPDLTVGDYQLVTRLGAPFKIFQPDVSPFRVEVARRIAAFNQAAGLPADWAVPAAERARIRTEVAREFFVAEHGRRPEDARELAATIAKHSRPRTQAVAGYDLTFSPVKSVSALWAVADPSTAAVIERAHRAAVGDALRFIEQHALFTPTGTNGVRQVEVRGLVAAAFTHRDSRACDPDLHTHVAVANKGRTGQQPARRLAAGDAGRRQPGQCRRTGHHPNQQPNPPLDRHRLGEERRPLDRPQSQPGRRPDGRHHRNDRTVRLPANYVRASVELGYATTVHTAQGVTADTMHGLVTGEESRQQLYTMLTRGRIANHLYLQVVGDGDPHSLIRPVTIHPSAATAVLERILARDDAARSATTLQLEQHHPTARLAEAAGHYVDALQVAAEDLAGREVDSVQPSASRR